jgi:aryl-alcohol dehydrogenase-like predicted oxidoreductase
MEYVPMPAASLAASRIALGTWSIGGKDWGGTDEQEALRTIAAALDRGVNLIDTAPIYGWGRSEELIGRVLAQRGGRDRLILATKFGLRPGASPDGPPVRDGSRKSIQRELENSLRRLGTDYIDIYQVHWPDLTLPLEDTAAMLEELRRQGKIRAIGVSNFTVAEMERFRGGGPLHTSQPPFNLFEREPERDILPYAVKNGIATLAYSPLCRGLLAGRLTPDARFADDNVRHADPKFQQPRFGRYLKAVARLDRLAQERFGKRVIHLAQRWVLDQRGVSAALWGARRPEQLAPLEQVLGWKLDAETLAEIDRILAETGVETFGPKFLAPPTGQTAAS